MIHPLLHLIATQPHLVTEHVEAYAELLGEEVAKTASMWKSRLMLNLAGAGLAGLGVVLGGVALMLWAAVPTGQLHAPWVLLMVPSTPLVAAVVCFVRAGRPIEPAAFASLKTQWQADLTMLRNVGAA